MERDEQALQDAMGSAEQSSKLTKSNFTEEIKDDPAEELDDKEEEDEADESDDENQNVFYKSSELIVSHWYIA